MDRGTWRNGGGRIVVGTAKMSQGREMIGAVLDPELWNAAVQSEAESDRFRCRCESGACGFRATQEDLRCDACRKPGHAHVYFGDQLTPLGIAEQFILTP